MHWSIFPERPKLAYSDVLELNHTVLLTQCDCYAFPRTFGISFAHSMAFATSFATTEFSKATALGPNVFTHRLLNVDLEHRMLSSSFVSTVEIIRINPSHLLC